ncbi:flippase [Rossellomorea sp. NS-SX7]|uniref:flippase n=1 Tax=Rossellomorea sp. NS-SX7 TaxID=3463856 RepID=UPI004059BBEA
MGNNKSIIKNVFYLFGSNVMVRLLSAAATILVARYLGAEEYGILSVALAFSSIAGYFTDLGLTHTLIREGTKKESNHDSVVSSFFIVRIALAVFTILLSIIIIQVFYDNEQLKSILYIVLIPTVAGATLQGLGAGYFQLIEEMKFTAVIRSITGLTTASALFLGMFFSWPIEVIAPIYGGANVVSGIVALILVKNRIKLFSGWHRGILDNLGSFMLSGVTVLALQQMGPIILEKVSTLKEAGFFSAAFRIPVVLYQLPGIVAMAFFPVLFRMGNNKDWDGHFKLSITQIKLMTFLGLVMAAPLFFYSHYLIELLLGSGWEKAGEALRILSIMIFLQSINYPLADALTTRGQQTRRTLIQLFVVLIGIAAYVVLGGMYGSLGGAYASIVTEGVMLIMFSLFLNRGLKIILKGILLNMAALIVTLSIFLLIYKHVPSILGMFILELILIVSMITADKQLKEYIKKEILKFKKRFK